MTFNFNFSGAVSAVALMVSASVATADVLFWSTQAKPAEEAQAMRDQVLSGFDGVRCVGRTRSIKYPQPMSQRMAATGASNAVNGAPMVS
jgi:hypothetical protein